MFKRFSVFFLGLIPLISLAGAIGTKEQPPQPPAKPVKLIFIHHSTGMYWLANNHGRLGIALRDNNYFVSDTNYYWGPDSIGSFTDIGHWWTWFRSSRRDIYLNVLFNESNQQSFFSRLAKDPGGENEIILFKSCYPNSQIGGNPNDPPTSGKNPLRGQDAKSKHMTVANVKGIYNDILTYFATRQDKLFIVITAPPLILEWTDASHAANARAVNNWLVNNWLANYPYKNVAVFDFYNVLTSNGGNHNLNDLGWATGNHHRYHNGAIEHLQTVAHNYSSYGTGPDNPHPTAAGDLKATGEFIALLNYYYNRWKGNALAPQAGTVTPSSGDVKAGTSKIFTTGWVDGNGCQDLKACYFLIDAKITPNRTIYLYYDPSENKLYLRSQDGSKWLGGYVPGSAKTIINSQANLDCGKTTVAKKRETIIVRWALTLKSSYLGDKNLYLKATDKGGLSSGWWKRGIIKII
jgi:hypothetical protein